MKQVRARASKKISYVYNARGKGACCTSIEVQLNGDLIDRVKIIDGCPGNHLGIEAPVKGRSAGEVVKLLRGTPCGSNVTSCPDQLARAIEEAIGSAARP